MVILVAIGLALTHQVLADKQTENVNIDKMQQILRSMRVDVEASQATAKYNSLIKNAYLINEKGEKVSGTEGIDPNHPAFSTDVAKDKSKGVPVFEAEKDGKNLYILPMTGKGLWGPIWGYIAVEEDGTTVYGTDFGHAGETPGLGAEIATLSFRKQFEGKNLIKENEFRSIAVVKSGQADAKRDYVDGISGGTITSKAVDVMLLESVGDYKNFLLNLHAGKKASK